MMSFLPNNSPIPLRGEISLHPSKENFSLQPVDGFVTQTTVDGSISFVTETKEQANYKQISQTSRASDRENLTFTQSACESSTFTESMFANHQICGDVLDKAILILSNLSSCIKIATNDVAIESVTTVWEYFIKTVLKTKDVTKEAFFYADGKHDVYLRIAIPAGKKRKYLKLSTPTSKPQRLQTKCFHSKPPKKLSKYVEGKFIHEDRFHHGEKRFMFSQNFLQGCSGFRVYKKLWRREDGPHNRPITNDEFSLDQNITRASYKYVKKHNQTADKHSIIVKQMQQIFAIPVYEITYKDGKTIKPFYIVGTNHKVYFP